MNELFKCMSRVKKSLARTIAVCAVLNGISEITPMSAFAGSSDWELYTQKDKMSDKESLNAERDNLVGNVNIKSIFTCLSDGVELKFIMLDRQGNPTGSMRHTSAGRYQIYVVKYRFDDNPVLENQPNFEYVNSLTIGFSPMFTEATQKANPLATIGPAPLDSLVKSKRLRVQLPAPALNDPVVDLDLANSKFTAFKEKCPVTSQQKSAAQLGIPACNSREAFDAVKYAVAHYREGDNLVLLELGDISELKVDSIKRERLCRGIAVLSGGGNRIQYRLWKDASGIRAEIRPE